MHTHVDSKSARPAPGFPEQIESRQTNPPAWGRLRPRKMEALAHSRRALRDRQVSKASLTRRQLPSALGTCLGNQRLSSARAPQILLCRLRLPRGSTPRMLPLLKSCPERTGKGWAALCLHTPQEGEAKHLGSPL